MKVNSEHLYNYINDLATDEKVKFKVYYDDNYETQIYWNGESFEWDTGTFTSEAFFNPLYDFEVIEEDKKIEQFTDGEMKVYHDMSAPIDDLAHKVSLIIDKINEIMNKLEENK